MREKKHKCGLCNSTQKPLTKTECCDNWICDDVDSYIIFSYARNSCYRNHDRYTLCAYHFHEGHTGKWQECEKCRIDFDAANYYDYTTNAYNFEKLKNLTPIKIKCAIVISHLFLLMSLLSKHPKGISVVRKSVKKQLWHNA